MVRLRSVGAALLLAVATAVVGCGDDGIAPGVAEQQAAFARWTSQGLTDYTVEIRISCFCDPLVHQWHRITVVDDSVRVAVLVDSTSAEAEYGPSHPEWFATVNSMFAQISMVRGRGDGSRVDATYDPIGMPTEIHFMAPPGVQDGDASYYYRVLQPLLVLRAD